MEIRKMYEARKIISSEYVTLPTVVYVAMINNVNLTESQRYWLDREKACGIWTEANEIRMWLHQLFKALDQKARNGYRELYVDFKYQSQPFTNPLKLED